MKANLTRGNSITENYRPHQIDVLFDTAYEIFKGFQCIPRPKGLIPGGFAIVGEPGQELILPKGTDIMPHKETLKYLRSNPIKKFEHGMLP